MQLKKILLKSNRLTKQIIVATSDFLLFFLSLWTTLSISLTALYIPSLQEGVSLFLSPVLGILIFYLSGIYRSVVRYINLVGILVIVRTLGILVVLDLCLFIFFGNLHIFIRINQELPSVLWIFNWLLTVVLIVGSRMIANVFFIENTAESKAIIYGAGSAGIQLAVALNHSSEMNPVCFIDKDPSLHGTFVGGLKVLSPKNLKKMIKRNKVDEVLIAMPSVSRSSLQSLLTEIEQYSVKVRILPGVAELAQGKVFVSELKEVDINDLLGRVEVNADQNLIKKNIKEKVVMVTGGGGSIGSEISRQVLQNDPRLLIIFDANEFSLYSIKQELLEKKSEVEIKSVLGNVRDQNRVRQVCEAFGVETIYHAAAYKHVPLVEENPFEAVSNNIFGTLNCVLAAIKCKVETFVLISTDKAVRPTNTMGATKRFAELILQSLSAENETQENTKITMVRFGNVLGSAGSAVPLFQKQISEGGPLTVTDPEIIRYFMSIPEAAELVIQAGAMGLGGEVFVLDMGEPVRILELAERLIRLSGMEPQSEENPDGDIEIIFTGLRPGEKLYEELLIGDNVGPTEHQQIYRANEEFISWKELDKYLNLLKEAESSSDHTQLRNIFKQTVSGYKPEEDIVDVIYLEQNKPS
jgi:FlaA1/EpsC-like NDP-sugar epimerase